MTDNPTGNRFCENCGLQLQLTCARCGHDVNLLARFCGNCGGVLNLRASVAAQETPKWGELKQATVLFADVVGSTDLVAHLDPEQAMARLRPAVLRMRHSVERFGGTVLRTLGDGVMAMFGVPRALEGHALLACQAALHMQAAFRHAGDGLQIRIGLHSGQVASDPEDAEDGRGGGAHGVTIHVASRVIALAPAGGICLTDACRAAAGSGCATEPMGSHPLKGIPQPVEIFRLTSASSSAPHRPLAPETTFRGRAHELGRLVSALDETKSKRGWVVGVAGEPGAGKSRLCQEFAQLCHERAVPVHEVRAQLYGHALPLQPILELFRVHFFGIAPGDDATAARSRIDECFAPVTSSRADLQLLHEFFGVADEGASALALGPRARQARLLALVRELIKHQADVERVILIEDLHWLDEASEEFVSALVQAVAGTRTLLLLNYRGHYHAPWAGAPHFQQIDLTELPAADMDALVAELLAPVTALPDVCRLVCRRAGGNPFFAEELARTLAESSLFAADTGLPEGGLEAVERALPATVEAVIGARLDRVGEPEKTLLQMCAIIGKEIPLAVLEHVANPIASHIQIGLDGLCQAGLILPQPSDGGRRFAFRHPLIQEVAYNAQLKVRRSRVHASVAAAMEVYYAEQLDEHAGLIAYHSEAAQQYLQAARYMARAARWVAATHSARGITAWRKVRTLLDQCSRTAEVDSLRAFASGRIVYLGWREGLPQEEVQQLTEEAIALASDADRRLVQLLLFAHGRLLQSSGGPADGYVDSLRRAMAISQEHNDGGRSATLQLALSHALAWAGMLDDALSANDEALKTLASIDQLDREFIGFSVEQWAWGIRVRILNKMGRFAEAQECLRRLSIHAESSADPVMRQLMHYAYVDHAWCSRDAVLAREHAEHVLRIADAEASPYSRVLARSSAAIAAHVAGELSEAKRQYAEALRLVRETRVGVDFEAEILAGLAECHLELCEFDSAATIAQKAADVSSQRSNRVAECSALVTLACALAADAQLREATALLHRAEQLFAQTSARALTPALERARAACRGELSALRAGISGPAPVA